MARATRLFDVATGEPLATLQGDDCISYGRGVLERRQDVSYSE